MALTSKQKKYLKKWLRKKSLAKLASELSIDQKEIVSYLEKKWPAEKFKRFSDKYLVKKKKNKVEEVDWEKKIKTFSFKAFLFKRKIWIIGLLFLIFFCYVNSLKNEFVSDDIPAIVENNQIGNFSYVFSNKFILGVPANFLRYFVFHLTGTNPLFYRLENILFHFGSTVLVLILLELLSNFRVAILAASMFAVHPIQIESVTWISGMPYSHAAFFVLLSFIFFLLSFKNNKLFNKQYIISILLFFLAILFSEKTIAFPFVLLFFVLSFSDFKLYWRKLTVYFLLSLFLGVLLVLLIPERQQALSSATGNQQQSLNPVQLVPIATTTYLELIFYPKNLSLYHSEFKLSSLEFYFRFIILLTLVGLIIFSFKKNKNLFFWLSFFFILLSPTLTPFGVSWIVAERYVYLAGLGIYVIFALFINKLMDNKKFFKLYLVIFSLIIFTLFVRTVVRNRDWQSHDTLWFATAKVVPDDFQNLNNLADYYSRHGDEEKAVDYLNKALEINPNFAAAQTNKGIALVSLGQLDEAEKSFKKSIELDPSLIENYANLGTLYFKKDQVEQAISFFEQALAINPSYQYALKNLGLIYQQLGETVKSQEYFNQLNKVR